MAETIKAGTILIKGGTCLPDILKLESKPYALGWMLVKGLDECALDRKARESGWTFFYLAGTSQVTVFGREGQETVGRAIRQILTNLRFEKPNCIEVARVVSKTFVGLHYAIVPFHSRNMQKSMFLFGDDDLHARDNSHEIKDARPLAA